MTAGMQSQVLSDLERYAFELLLVRHAAEETGTVLPGRVLGPSPADVATLATPLLATPQARVLRAFVDAHATDIHRCLIESSTFAQARGRVAAWVARSLPAAARLEPARFVRPRAGQPA